MVIKKNIMKKRYALISTYEKKGIIDLCNVFSKYNIEILSTGSTNKHILKSGFNSTNIANITGFDEILDGRVKTLHPKIHASLLYDRENKSHTKIFNRLKFPKIDFLIVNLYPFEKAIKENQNSKKCIEMIDIGGITLLRSAAKNFQSVTAIPSPDNYSLLINNINKNKGFTSLRFRKKMATKVFQKTSEYDDTITDWLLKINNAKINNKYSAARKLRYGENPNQKAEVYFSENKPNIFDNKIQGKDISYNNILDIDSAINCLSDFTEPTTVIIKHNNPCGVASGKNTLDSFVKAYNCDPLSAYGGELGTNKIVDKNVANKFSQFFFEIIVAKKFTKDALLILNKKKNLILIATNNLLIEQKKEIKTINGGYVIQDKNIVKIDKKIINCVSNKKSSKKEIEDLIFAFKVCKFVKSNAVVLVKNKQTVGIGAGQMSRIDSTDIALKKNKKNMNQKRFVAASDAFFPFTDSIKALIKYNCSAIVQPSGSKNDKIIIDYTNKNNLSLYFTKFRLFKH